MKNRILFIALTILSLTITSCQSVNSITSTIQQKTQEASNQAIMTATLPGVWETEKGVYVDINIDGTCEIKGSLRLFYSPSTSFKGKWEITGDTVIIIFDNFGMTKYKIVNPDVLQSPSGSKLLRVK